MEYQVIISPAAVCDIKEIHTYINEAFGQAKVASNVIEKIFERLDSLSSMPKRIHPLENQFVDNYPVRATRVGNYLILLIVNDEKSTVEVLRIAYYRRNMSILKLNARTTGENS